MLLPHRNLSTDHSQRRPRTLPPQLLEDGGPPLEHLRPKLVLHLLILLFDPPDLAVNWNAVSLLDSLLSSSAVALLHLLHF
ncbi:unnamed protein product [Musa acuminata var. zebrina]